MRTLALSLVLAAACGGNSKAPDAAPSGDGSGNTPDAPMLPACANPANGTHVTATLVTTVGPSGAMLVTAPVADPRLFILERGGAIRIFDNGQLQAAPFFDLADSAFIFSTGQGEQGLLGLAFHPQYATNRTFFIYYTTSTTDVVARCTGSAADPNTADPICTPILSIPDFASNHNGGMMEFGKDGFLYIGTGDGGSGGDPRRNAQATTNGSPNANTVALLGKMLRIDVDHPANGKEYGIPTDNPFATAGGEPEIFMIGLRNPWRWSFDKLTGDLWIGDVGQVITEEIDVLKAGEQNGKNLGWSVYEGNDCCANQNCQQTAPLQPCDATGKTLPLDTRAHSAGWAAIIGGEVYRGSCYPDINGWYFYTDNSRRIVVRAILQPNGTLDTMDLPGTWPAGPASIHADARGELYLTTTSGSVYHLQAGP